MAKRIWGKLPRSISKTAKESSLNKKLDSIIDDRTSGAADIERKIIMLFEGIFKEHEGNSQKYLRKAIDKIKKRFSPMANILNLLEFAKNLLNEEVYEQIPNSLKKYRQDIGRNREKTVRRAAGRIKSYGSIFTLSGSSLILKSIMEAKHLGWNGDVKIVESRPKKEGAVFARKIGEAGIKTVMGVDANMPRLIGESGALFLGADAVTQTCFVNKIGSDISVDYADKFGKPVYVVADKSKFISDKTYKFKYDDNPESEILRGKPKKLEIINNYFEKIDPRGKFKYVCGDQVITPDKIKNLLKRKP